MKPHHTRAYSASQRKPNQSQDTSPITGTYSRKENSNIFQVPDLNNQFKFMTKNANKQQHHDNKLLTTNVFINNLNIQVKPNSTTKKTGINLNHPQSAKRTPKMSGSGTPAHNEENKDPRGGTYNQQYGNSNDAHHHDKNHHAQHHQNGSPYNSKRDLASLLARKNNESYGGNYEMSRTNYVSSTKPRTNESLSNKNSFRSPPKLFSPFESANRKKTHQKNQKSLDVNMIQGSSANPRKMQPYPTGNTYQKPPTTADNSPREDRHSMRKTPKHEPYSYQMTNTTNSKLYKTPGTEKMNLASKIPMSRQTEKKSVPLKQSTLTSKHRKTPSFDIYKRNDSVQHKSTTPTPNLDRVRKSADHGDQRLSGISTLDSYAQNQKLMGQSAIQQGIPPKPQSQRLTQNLRYAIRTRAGVMHNGMRKINQDSFIAHSNFGKKKDRYYFGVCDGHGMNGHFVSGFVKETLPVYLLSDPKFEQDPKSSLINSFELCQQKLLVCDFDCKFSGTTCVTLLIDGNRIIVANAGDSRAIKAGYNKGWDFIPLSIDHKPNMVQEAQRIFKAGGRIEPFKDGEGNYVGPSRVWLMHQDIPGLAMSRSIGDIVASTVGVSCTPEIKEFKIHPEDRFMVIASDGVWEFINNVDVVKMVAPYYEQNNIDGACDTLLNAAVKSWAEEEDTIVDDITLIVIFF